MSGKTYDEILDQLFEAIESGKIEAVLWLFNQKISEKNRSLLADILKSNLATLLNLNRSRLAVIIEPTKEQKEEPS